MSQNIILGLDCATRWTNLGVSIDGTVIGEINVNIGREQASKLPELVNKLLDLTDIALNQISAVALTVGPGYFTGVRVGLAYGCALAKGLGISVIPLTTLEVMAFPVVRMGVVAIPIIWAGRGGVYCAAYDNKDGEMNVLCPPLFCCATNLHEIATRIPSDVPSQWLCDDKSRIMTLFPEEKVSNCIHLIPSGGNIAQLGHIRRNMNTPADRVQAYYLREPDFGKN
ncbi:MULTISPECIES: tRNA (adenosine(37)-N6)-threonylcarbamoyltransferase complex dimerization subunit type 1 TsaB [Aminobacterium]|jgi:tRNA threonylcarbamoyladenosine biosynthesis protein TsaB|uniref:tRNA (adenosine(37)-N6)-threonylcarbamoyltransferase complex dimerization subunit type 1 TsaB n=1 Tax=Aminobacterium TaxID=81466 RepID=UPI0025810401|nr:MULTISPECIES: tRNA (adenosine(37)-N6)-threonylcarbamoyltransferase complex dimerization subunit type 1 TsaB [unclassified Aminobacterium]